MKTSDKGKAQIKKHEQLRLNAYKPTKNDVWTIGWGSTRGVKEGDKITLEEAERRLAFDLVWAEDCVNDAVDVELTQEQFDALVSLVFNIGGSAFRSSTLLKLLNQSNFVAAAKQFPRWNKQAGKILDGLTARRKSEMELFLA